jgi:hypothetical protein
MALPSAAPPSRPMKPREKYLYHQIHPLKLFTDIDAAFGSICHQEIDSDFASEKLRVE